MNTNIRRQLYKRYRIEGYSSYSAAIKAGYAERTARSGKVAKTVNLDKCLEIAGLTDKVIAERVKERALNDDGAVGHKYLETALKLKQAKGYSSTQEGVSIEKAVVNIYLPDVNT